MKKTAAHAADAEWNIAVPPDLDEDSRLFLACRGAKEASFPLLVRKAASLVILSSLTREVKEEVRRSGLSQEELDGFIADGIAWARSPVAAARGSAA